MNQAILLNNDLSFCNDHSVWKITGFYQAQGISVYIKTTQLTQDTEITPAILLDIEADIEDWLEINEPDENNEIFL